MRSPREKFQVRFSESVTLDSVSCGMRWWLAEKTFLSRVHYSSSIAVGSTAQLAACIDGSDRSREYSKQVIKQLEYEFTGS